jgi:hypothetical protein
MAKLSSWAQNPAEARIQMVVALTNLVATATAISTKSLLLQDLPLDPS